MPTRYSLRDWLLGLTAIVALTVGLLFVFNALRPLFGWSLGEFGLATAVIVVWYFARLRKRAQSGT